MEVSYWKDENNGILSRLKGFFVDTYNNNYFFNSLHEIFVEMCLTWFVCMIIFLICFLLDLFVCLFVWYVSYAGAGSGCIASTRLPAVSISTHQLQRDKNFLSFVFCLGCIYINTSVATRYKTDVFKSYCLRLLYLYQSIMLFL